jgi:hypothetical protein
MASYVVVASCTRAVPTLVVSPTTRTAAPGAVASYTLTLTNNDAACASNMFMLTGAGGAASWSHVFGTGPVSLTSGGSVSFPWFVTSDASASDGDYTVTATATSADSGNGSISATYTVVTAPPIDAGLDAPIDAAPPTDAGLDAPLDAGPEPDAGPGSDAPWGPDAGDEPPGGGGGCCSAHRDGSGSAALAAFVLASLLARRRRLRVGA